MRTRRDGREVGGANAARKHTKTDALISDKGDGVYRHRFCFRSSSEASEFVWILWLVDALVDGLVDGLVEAGIVDAAYDGLVVGVVDVGDGLGGLDVVARGRFGRHLQMVGDRGFRLVASSYTQEF